MWAFIYQPLLYCYILLGAMPSAKHPVKAFHPIHVSTTNIEFNAKDDKLEVICTIFTDDFEAALTKQFHQPTDLEKTDLHKAMDVLVKGYVLANVKINPGTTPANLNYIGFEINREAVDVYFESDKIAPV